MANYARSITRGERMGVDGVKGCSCPVDGPGRLVVEHAAAEHPLGQGNFELD